MTRTVEDLTAAVNAFVDVRDWRRFHNPKNLVLALVGEVGEVAELVQWLTAEEAAALAGDAGPRDELADELADVAIYLLRLADEVGIDLAAAIEAKLARNAERFPAGSPEPG
jgi:NTP pyrophosphatase (non-canonical NTP hydrolase)